MEAAEFHPLRERFPRIGPDLGSPTGEVDMEKDMDVDREDGNFTSRPGTPESDSGPRPDMIPVQDSPSLSAHLPSPQVPAEGRQYLEPSFDKKCAPPQAPRADGAQYDELTRAQLHDQRTRRGFEDAVLKTRLATMGAAGANRNLLEGTPGGGKRERAPVKGEKDFVGQRDRAPADGGEGLGYSGTVFGIDPWGR